MIRFRRQGQFGLIPTKGFMMRKVVVLACVLSLLASVAILVGCSSGSSAQTPEQVAKAFFTAYQKKDASTSWNLLTADSQKSVQKESAWAEYLKEAPAIKFTVGKVTVNGDKANAEVAGTVAGQTSTETVPLVKEKGVWKVDMAALANSTSQ